MAIYTDAYKTYAGEAYSKTIDEIKFQLEVAKINGSLVTDERFSNISLLIDPSVDQVPVFPHPVIIENKEREEGFNLFLDLRAYGRKDRSSGEYILRDTNECTLQVNRGYLNNIWILKDPSYFLTASDVPLSIFSSWISELISRRFSLNPREQLDLAIYAAYYYITLFSNNYGFNSDDNTKIATMIAKAVRASTVDVFTVIEDIDFKLNGIKDFSDNVFSVIDNIKLEKFNTTVLFQLISYSWFGANAKEIIGVSLEHPPTFTALCLAALTDRSYRNTPLAKIAGRRLSKNDITVFHRAFTALIDD